MASEMVSSLTSIGTAQVPTDLLYIVDLSAGVAGSKKITLNDIFAFPTRNVTDKAQRFQGLATASAPALSGANESSIYFDSDLDSQMLSENAGAYDALVSATKGQTLTNKTTVSLINTGVLTIAVSDAGDTTVSTVLDLQHANSTGVGAAGFGSRIRFGLESTTTLNQEAAEQIVQWEVATHASRTANTTFQIIVNASLKSWLNVRGNQPTATPVVGIGPDFTAALTGAAVQIGSLQGAAPRHGLSVEGSFRTVPVDLTDAATVATDCMFSNNFRVTLGGNRTLSNPTNPVDGQVINWELIQDGAGSRTLALGAKFAFGSDITAVVLSTGAGLRDFLTVKYDSVADKFYVVAFVKGY